MKIYSITTLSKRFMRLSSTLGCAVAILFMMNTAVLAQPAVPTLLSPIDTAEDQPHGLNLLWEFSENAESYTLQVSTDDNFDTLIFDESGLTDSTQFIEELDFSTDYYWRVSASGNTETSDFSSAFMFTTWDSIPKGPDPVVLGFTSNFAILAHTAVTNVPGSAIKGDVGLSPAAGSFIDLTEDEVTGIIYTVDASGPAGSVVAPEMLTDAKGDLTIAYNDAAGRTVNPIGIAGNIGGQTLFPGLYKSTGTLEISAGDLTLDGGGHDDAVWIFQIASSFNMTSDRKVYLTNGANAANIFWQVGSAATFGTTTVMKGTIMAGTQVTIATGGTLDGRAMALNENVTLQQNTINLPDSTSTNGTGNGTGDGDTDTDGDGDGNGDGDGDGDENGDATSITDSDDELPAVLKLSQNYPNPFNPTTTIQFELNADSNVRLEVFNMLGQSMGILLNEPKSAGIHTVKLDASTFTSGMYIYQITSNNTQITKQMMLVK